MKRASRTNAKSPDNLPAVSTGYDDVLASVVELLESARRTSARVVNSIMTAAYWEIGRRIVEGEQQGVERAEYGEALIKRLSCDLARRFGKGFSLTNLKQFKKFYLLYRSIGKGQTLSDLLGSTEKGQAPSDFSAELPQGAISETPSRKWRNEIFQTPSGKLDLRQFSHHFPLPWSHYVRLLKVEKPEARRFYETEALRGGWSVRQLDRLPDKVLAAEYRTALPDEKTLAAELERTQAALASRLPQWSHKKTVNRKNIRK